MNDLLIYFIFESYHKNLVKSRFRDKIDLILPQCLF